MAEGLYLYYGLYAQEAYRAHLGHEQFGYIRVSQTVELI